MLTTNVPAAAELVGRVESLIPVLREQAEQAERDRRLPEKTLQALAEAGVFRLRTPRRYGGYETDTRTLVDVASRLAQADGSLAWVASVYWIPTWMAGLFPDDVQDEIFATEDVRICGTLSPSGTATPVDGGIVVNGRWGFQTGAWHAQWQEIIAVLIQPDAEPQPVVALVPTSDVTLLDDWHTAGLRGTGSVTTTAENLFVPARRVLPLGAVLSGQGASAANSDSPMYRAPLLPVASASSVGTVVGLARAALAAFLERLPDRKITYTEYEHQGDAPLTHHQVALATLKVDEAAFHAERLADLVDGKTAAGAGWSLLERATARLDLGAACRLARDSADLLANASGGSSVRLDVPIQRIARDVHAVNLHALMNPDTNTELYGRIACGLPPNTPYL